MIVLLTFVPIKGNDTGVKTKYCPACKETLPLSCFSKSKERKDGMQGHCKSCRKEHVRRNQKHYNKYHSSYRQHPKWKKWYKAWKAKTDFADHQRAYRERLRLQAIQHYGGKCKCCGESILAFLVIDHINGGGTRQRKRSGLSGTQIYRWLKKRGYPDGFRVLCHNCNWGVHVGRGKCPHHNDTICTVERKVENAKAEERP